MFKTGSTDIDKASEPINTENLLLAYKFQTLLLYTKEKNKKVRDVNDCKNIPSSVKLTGYAHEINMNT